MPSSRVNLFAALTFLIAVFPSANAQSENLPNPYRYVEDWARFPKGKEWSGSIYAPGVDSKGNVWVLTRCGVTNCAETSAPAVLEFDPSGRYIKGIGGGIFAFPHGFFIDKDDNIWVTDSGVSKGKGNQVTKLTPDGKVLLQLGKAGALGGGPENFIGASAVLVAPNGDIFVADGHAALQTGGGRSLGYNAQTSDSSHMRIAKFSKDGKFIKSFGKLGKGPGEFHTPHGLAMDSKGRLFVADRGNNRIQIFDQDGKFLDEWKQFGKPVSLVIDKHDMVYAIDSDSIGNLWDYKYSSVGQPCAECLVRIPRLTDVGEDSPGFTQGIRIGSATDGVVRTFIPALHGAEGPTTLPEYMAVDAEGNLYVAEARTMSLKKYFKKVQLPEGHGREAVQRACALCHDFDEFPRVNFDHEQWLAAVKTMIRGGAPLKQEEIPVVADYLANNFKGTPTPGVTVPGPVEVKIDEWNVPSADSMPYGIYHSKVNGYTWYAGTFSNTIGRFDPKTQQFQEFNLRPGTNPVTLIEWPSANFQGVSFFVPLTGNFIGEFHTVDGPYEHWKTGDVMERPVRGPKLQFHQIAVSRFPHHMWFSVSESKEPLFPEGSKLGSLMPWTSEIKLTDTATANANPYAVAVDDAGTPYFTMRNSAKIASVNQHTSQVTEFVMPDPTSSARGITITSDGIVWYTDYARGYLGRLDPKTGKFSEWASPSGRTSRPYAITNAGGAIWYTESGTSPNMLVRFDPKTEKFQSWSIKDGGSVRQIFAATDGTLWFTRPMQSGIGRATPIPK
jgi:streptogramin lyase